MLAFMVVFIVTLSWVSVCVCVCVCLCCFLASTKMQDKMPIAKFYADCWVIMPSKNSKCWAQNSRARIQRNRGHLAKSWFFQEHSAQSKESGKFPETTISCNFPKKKILKWDLRLLRQSPRPKNSQKFSTFLIAF